jgi:hypothetical protein
MVGTGARVSLQFTKALPLSRCGSHHTRHRTRRSRHTHRNRRSGNHNRRNRSRGSHNPGTRNLGTRNHRNDNPTPSAAGRCRCFPCRTNGMSPG